MKIERVYKKAIYPDKLIQRAVKDYASVGTIEVRPIQEGFRCVFSSLIVETERMANEFDNYMIELINSGEHDADL